MKLNKILKLSAFTLLCTSSIMAAMGDNMTAGIGVSLGNDVQSQTWIDNSTYQDSIGNGPLAGVSLGSSFALSDAGTSATVIDFRNTYYQRIRTDVVGMTAQHKMKTASGAIHGLYGGVDYTSYDSMNFWQGALGIESTMSGYLGNLNFYIPFGGNQTYSGVAGSTITGLYGVDLTVGKMIDMFGMGAKAAYYWNDDIKNNISSFSLGGEYTFAKNMLNTGATYEYRNGLDSSDYGFKVFARVPLHKGTFSSLTGLNPVEGASQMMMYKPVNRMYGGVLQAKDITCALGDSSYSIGGSTACMTDNPYGSVDLKAGILSDTNNMNGDKIKGIKVSNTAQPGTPINIPAGLYILNKPVFLADGANISPGAIFVLDKSGMIVSNSKGGATQIGQMNKAPVTFIRSRDLLSALQAKGTNPSATAGLVKLMKRAGVQGAPKGRRIGQSSMLNPLVMDNDNGVGLVLLGGSKMFLADSQAPVSGRPGLLAARARSATAGMDLPTMLGRPDMDSVPDFFSVVLGDNYTQTASTGGSLASTLTSSTVTPTMQTNGASGPASITLPVSPSPSAIPSTPTLNQDFTAGDTTGDGKISFAGGLLSGFEVGGGTDDFNKGQAAILQNVLMVGNTIGAVGSNLMAKQVNFTNPKMAAISMMGGQAQIEQSSFVANQNTSNFTDMRNGVIAHLHNNSFDATMANPMFKAHSVSGKSTNVNPRLGAIAKLAQEAEAAGVGATATQTANLAAAQNLLDAAPRLTLTQNSHTFGQMGGSVLGLSKLQNQQGAGVALSMIGNSVDFGQAKPVVMSNKTLAMFTQKFKGNIGNIAQSSSGINASIGDIGNDESASFDVSGRKNPTFSAPFSGVLAVAASGGNASNDATSVSNLNTNYAQTLADMQDQGANMNLFKSNQMSLPVTQAGDLTPLIVTTLQNMGLGSQNAPTKMMLGSLSDTSNAGSATSPKTLAVSKLTNVAAGGTTTKPSIPLVSAPATNKNLNSSGSAITLGQGTYAGNADAEGLTLIQANSGDSDPIELKLANNIGASQIPSLQFKTNLLAAQGITAPGSTGLPGAAQGYGATAGGTGRPSILNSTPNGTLISNKVQVFGNLTGAHGIQTSDGGTNDANILAAHLPTTGTSDNGQQSFSLSNQLPMSPVAAHAVGVGSNRPVSGGAFGAATAAVANTAPVDGGAHNINNLAETSIESSMAQNLVNLYSDKFQIQALGTDSRTMPADVSSPLDLAKLGKLKSTAAQTFSGNIGQLNLKDISKAASAAQSGTFVDTVQTTAGTAGSTSVPGIAAIRGLSSFSAQQLYVLAALTGSTSTQVPVTGTGATDDSTSTSVSSLLSSGSGSGSETT